MKKTARVTANAAAVASARAVLESSMGRILPRILPIVAVLMLPSMPAFSQFAGQTLVQPSPPPSQKKAPVAERAAKVCQEYGAGYMRVEGTGSCVKIGGYVRAQGSVR